MNESENYYPYSCGLFRRSYRSSQSEGAPATAQVPTKSYVHCCSVSTSFSSAGVRSKVSSVHYRTSFSGAGVRSGDHMVVPSLSVPLQLRKFPQEILFIVISSPLLSPAPVFIRILCSLSFRLHFFLRRRCSLRRK
uniref:Uncharacterized protein n=1 Tax=Nelumbo nucifera TaxID=4432 RepID=A0A822YGU8_NELNU|nr:TPA_asm: hypothetical protein HUJ06_030166 [Nelumbo nucifera]